MSKLLGVMWMISVLILGYYCEAYSQVDIPGMGKSHGYYDANEPINVAPYDSIYRHDPSIVFSRPRGQGVAPKSAGLPDRPVKAEKVKPEPKPEPEVKPEPKPKPPCPKPPIVKPPKDDTTPEDKSECKPHKCWPFKIKPFKPSCKPKHKPVCKPGKAEHDCKSDKAKPDKKSFCNKPDHKKSKGLKMSGGKMSGKVSGMKGRGLGHSRGGHHGGKCGKGRR